MQYIWGTCHVFVENARSHLKSGCFLQAVGPNDPRWSLAVVSNSFAMRHHRREWIRATQNNCIPRLCGNNLLWRQFSTKLRKSLFVSSVNPNQYWGIIYQIKIKKYLKQYPWQMHSRDISLCTNILLKTRIWITLFEQKTFLSS